MIRYTLQEGKPEAPLLAEIELLYRELFGIIDSVKFHQRTSDARKMFTVLAWDELSLVGFKTGYAIDDGIFYSWIGGVKESYRKTGIANELMRHQHRWCAENGFARVRTKTMNRWKSMLILNLKNGFNIISTYTDEKGELKIILEKDLRKESITAKGAEVQSYTKR